MSVKLGQTVRCLVTGFEGVATARVEYINGCVQICVKPKIKDGETKMPDGEYIDIHQLEVLNDGVSILTSNVGGDQKDVPNQ